MFEIQGNQRRSNVCTTEDLEEENQNNGREVIF